MSWSINTHVLGAGTMLMKSIESPAELRKQVTSPNGTTAAAIASFESNGFVDIVKKAVQAATLRSLELGKN